MSFDNMVSLQFIEAVYVTYAIVGMYKDRSFQGLKDVVAVVAKNPCDLSFEYERVYATKRAPPRNGSPGRESDIPDLGKLVW